MWHCFLVTCCNRSEGPKGDLYPCTLTLTSEQANACECLWKGLPLNQYTEGVIAPEGCKLYVDPRPDNKRPTSIWLEHRHTYSNYQVDALKYKHIWTYDNCTNKR